MVVEDTTPCCLEIVAAPQAPPVAAVSLSSAPDPMVAAARYRTVDRSLPVGIAPERAEALKVAGPPQAEDPFRERDLDVSSHLTGFVTALAEGVRTSIDSLRRSVGAPLGRVWLSGGESRLPRLDTRLAVELDARGRVAVLDGRAWVSNPEKLREASDATGQDLTVALAASVSLGGTR